MARCLQGNYIHSFVSCFRKGHKQSSYSKIHIDIMSAASPRQWSDIKLCSQYGAYIPKKKYKVRIYDLVCFLLMLWHNGSTLLDNICHGNHFGKMSFLAKRVAQVTRCGLHYLHFRPLIHHLYHWDPFCY